MCKWLARIDFTREKSFGYSERNEKKRSIYSEELARKDPKPIVYIDESGSDDNEVYPYAWGKKGARIYAMKSGVKQKGLSIIGALNQNNFKAPFVFEGTCTREVFEIYLFKILLHILNQDKPSSWIMLALIRIISRMLLCEFK